MSNSNSTKAKWDSDSSEALKKLAAKLLLPCIVVVVVSFLGLFAGLIINLTTAKTRMIGRQDVRIRKSNTPSPDLEELNHQEEMIKPRRVESALESIQSEFPTTRSQRELLAKQTTLTRTRHDGKYLLQVTGDDPELIRHFMTSLFENYRSRLDQANHLVNFQERRQEFEKQRKPLLNQQLRLQTRIQGVKNRLATEYDVWELEQKKKPADRPAWREWFGNYAAKIARLEPRIAYARRMGNPWQLKPLEQMFEELDLPLPDLAKHYFSSMYGLKHLEFLKQEYAHTYGRSAFQLREIESAIEEWNSAPPDQEPAPAPEFDQVLDELLKLVRSKIKINASMTQAERQQVYHAHIKLRQNEIVEIEKELAEVNAELKKVERPMNEDFKRLIGGYSAHVGEIQIEEYRRSWLVDSLVGGLTGFLLSSLLVLLFVLLAFKREKQQTPVPDGGT